MNGSSIAPYEVGTLSSSTGEDESHFLGSSSGVYFVNTVQRAFALSTKACHTAKIGEGAEGNVDREALYLGQGPHFIGLHELEEQIGPLPDQKTARHLTMAYFRLWHPILPFVYGPTFMENLNSLYSGGKPTVQSAEAIRLRPTCFVMVQCIMNIAALDADIHLRAQSRVRNAASLLAAVGTIMHNHKLETLQALLAAQLYLLATMSLQAASTVGGILVKSIFHAGCHRCPARYPQITQGECEMRKRIFWCFYSMDRYLSQALGTPLVLQDSDIDVCWPGQKETHQSGNSVVETNVRDEAFGNFVEFARLTGQLIELFHKSLRVRTYNRSDILELTSNVHAWWNSLPSDLQDSPSIGNELTAAAGSLFSILYQNSILLLNRPFLSLDTKLPEFRSSLQGKWRLFAS